jgi:hypothetical protein
MDFQIITNEHAELQEMGLSCMRGLVEKFGEKLVNQALDILENYLLTAADTQAVGICKTMLNMAEAASMKLLPTIKERLIYIV